MESNLLGPLAPKPVTPQPETPEATKKEGPQGQTGSMQGRSVTPGKDEPAPSAELAQEILAKKRDEILRFI